MENKHEKTGAARLSEALARQAYSLAATGLVAAAAGPALLYSRLTRKPVPGLVPGFSQRMGRYEGPLFTPEASPRIWMHAVSVGEVGVARAIVRELCALLPTLGLVLSTGTPTGKAQARALMPECAQVVYAPLDFPPALRASLSSARPRCLVFTETELWPGWIREAGRRNIPVVVVNGRLSERSLRSYQAAGSLFRGALDCVSAFSMASQGDALRMARLIRDESRVIINGSAKFDGLALRASGKGKVTARKKLGIPQNRKVLVCGSTRSGEEEILLSAFAALRQRFPDALLVLAPRHLERLSRVSELTRAAGLSQIPWTRAAETGVGDADCMLLDAMGELFDTYAAADLAFCGASLVPLGGQNLLEPAAWSVPVCFGPHTEDFAEARDLLLAREGGFVVRNAEELARTALRLLADPVLLAAAGKNAQAAVLRQQGAAARHAAVIAEHCKR